MAEQISSRPRIGLMTFGDERDYMWEGYFGGLTMPRHEEAREYLGSLPLEVIAFADCARSKQVVDRQVKELKAAGVEALFAHTPCWSTPNIVVRAVQGLGLPTVIMTSKSAATHGMVGMFGAAGTLSQVGVEHIRIRDDFGAPVFAEKMLPYFRAASVKARLRGRVMGIHSMGFSLMPLGALLLGALAENLGAAPAVWLACGLYLVGIMLVGVRKPIIRRLNGQLLGEVH